MPSPPSDTETHFIENFLPPSWFWQEFLKKAAICGNSQYLFAVFAKICQEIDEVNEKNMAPMNNPEERLWRTDTKRGRGIYALLSNDLSKISRYDPLVGVMESSELAEIVVDTHNRVLMKFGRHYLKALSMDD